MNSKEPQPEPSEAELFEKPATSRVIAIMFITFLAVGGLSAGEAEIHDLVTNDSSGFKTHLPTPTTTTTSDTFNIVTG